MKIPEFSRICLPEKVTDKTVSDPKLVGKEGKGVLWKAEIDEEEDIRNTMFGEFARDMTKVLYQEEALKTDSEPDLDESEVEYDEEDEKRREF